MALKHAFCTLENELAMERSLSRLALASPLALASRTKNDRLEKRPLWRLGSKSQK